MITRRAVLGSAVASCLCGISHAAPTDMGCWVDEREADNLKRVGELHAIDPGAPPIIHTSGIPLFDRALAHALLRLAHDFEVYPGFGYIEEHNAKATPRNWLARADGTVLMGRSFLNTLLARPEHPDACIVAICAHEFAHIAQYKLGIASKLRATHHTVKNLELHADYLSGWFAGRRKLNNPDYPAVMFAALARDNGGQLSDKPDFHGTPEERGSAVEAGFLSSAQDKLTLTQAVEAGTRYVTRGFRSAPVVDFKR